MMILENHREVITHSKLSSMQLSL